MTTGHDAHDRTDEILANLQVPATTGIPDGVRWAGIGAIILCFIVAGLVLTQAGYNHMWPAANTLRLKL